MYRCCWVFLFSATAFAADLSVLPGPVTLDGPESYQQLLAEAARDGHQEDWTRTGRWTSSDSAVAKVDARDGAAGLRWRGHHQCYGAGTDRCVVVHVKNARRRMYWSFRNDVIPVMSKVGCNSGACHGAAAGKNGFKLTLRGYDPDEDYDTLTRESLGRRVSLSEPSHSLMLLKPTFAIPHGGGKRFATDSLEYRVIAEWIAAGAPPSIGERSDGDRTGGFPGSATLKPGAEQQIVVRAKYSDGRLRDVTRWVKLRIERRRCRRRWTMRPREDERHRRSRHHAVVCQPRAVLAPERALCQQSDPDVYTKFQRRNYIDDLVLAKLKALNIAPSGRPTMPRSSAARIWMPPAFCPPPKKSRIFWPTSRRINAPS